MATKATHATAEVENKEQLPRNLVNPLATLTQYSAYLNTRERRRRRQQQQQKQQNQQQLSSLPSPISDSKLQQPMKGNREYRGLNPSDFATAILRTGHTLRVPVQPVVGTAIVLFQRYILLSAASAAAIMAGDDINENNDEKDIGEKNNENNADPIPFSPTAVAAGGEHHFDDSAVAEEDIGYAAAAAACLFVAAKTHNFNGITYEPVTMLAVYNYHLEQIDQPTSTSSSSSSSSSSSNNSAAQFAMTLPELYRTEMEVLRQMCFTTGAASRVGASSVVLPYSFALTYIQALKLTNQPIARNSNNNIKGDGGGGGGFGELTPESKSNSSDSEQALAEWSPDPGQGPATLAQLVWRLVTDSLVLGTDGVLHTVHQPNTLACACIHLACAHLGVGISGPARSVNTEEWWKVFDVRTDDFRHCLVSLLCMDLL